MNFENGEGPMELKNHGGRFSLAQAWMVTRDGFGNMIS